MSTLAYKLRDITESVLDGVHIDSTSRPQIAALLRALTGILIIEIIWHKRELTAQVPVQLCQQSASVLENRFKTALLSNTSTERNVYEAMNVFLSDWKTVAALFLETANDAIGIAKNQTGVFKAVKVKAIEKK